MAALAEDRELTIWQVSKFSSHSGDGNAVRTSGNSWPKASIELGGTITVG